MGPERLVQIKKWNCQNKILVPSKSGPQKYSWKSAKVARKLRERRAKAELPNQRPLPHELTSNIYNFPFYVLYEVSIAVFGCRNWFMKVSKDKRHLFSQDPKRKLAKARIQVAKRWGKLMAKDHVIRMECARLSFLKHADVLLYICFHGIPRESSRKQLCCDCCSRKLKLRSRKVRERS